jgi:peroxiredoxin Q/BCP
MKTADSMAIAMTAFMVTAETAGAGNLVVGDPAPDFALEGSDGKAYSMKELRGKTVVLAWFPKAFTGG